MFAKYFPTMLFRKRYPEIKQNTLIKISCFVSMHPHIGFFHGSIVPRYEGISTGQPQSEDISYCFFFFLITENRYLLIYLTILNNLLGIFCFIHFEFYTANTEA